MSRENLPKLNLSPAEDDLKGWDISVLVYTEMGFDESPCFAIVCVVFTPAFAVIGMRNFSFYCCNIRQAFGSKKGSCKDSDSRSDSFEKTAYFLPNHAI